MLTFLIAAALAADPIPPAGQRALSIAWEVPVAGTSSPMITGMDDGVAVTTREGRVTAWGAGGGAPLWQADLGAPVGGTPSFWQGRLVVLAGSGDDARLLLLDPSTGEPAARAPLGPGAAGTLAAGVKAGIAVAGVFSGAPGLVLFDPADASPRWRAPLPETPSAPPVQCGGAIYVGGAEGTLASIDAADGRLLWKKRIGGPITTPLLCNGRRGYVGSADNRLHALRLSRRRCRRLWALTTGGDIAGRPAIYQQRVLFFSYDTYLYAAEADNGHLAWKTRLSRRPRQDSLVLGGLLLVAQLNSDRLESFVLPEGGQGAVFPLEAGRERFVTAPVRAGRMVVIGAARYGEESSRLLAFDPEAAAGSGAAPAPR